MRCARCRTMAGGPCLCTECRRGLAVAQVDVREVEQRFGDALRALGADQHTKAVRTLQKVLQIDADHAGAHEALIIAYGRMGRLDRALQTLSALHRVCEANAPAARRTTTTRPRRVSARTLTARRAADAACLPVDLALFYRQMHELELAERVLAGALASGEASAEAHLVQGSVHRVQGRPRLALAELKKAREGEGGAEHAALSYEIGLCHEALGQLKKAVQSVTAAIGLEPDNPHMHLTLGMLYEKQGRPRLARRAYRVAASLHDAFAPALVDISFRLGLSALEDGNLERAVTEFSAALSENESLFAPPVANEIEHLISHLIEGEHFRTYVESTPAVQGLAAKALSDLEDVFGVAARLGFFVGLSCLWESAGEDDDAPCDADAAGAPVLAEPEATWLERLGPSGHVLRGATPPAVHGRTRKGGQGRRVVDEEAEVRNRLARPDSVLGFPPVPFEFVFEEWLNAQARMARARIIERPLVPPDIYQRLLTVLGGSVQRARVVLEREGVIREEDEEDSSESVDLGVALWGAIVEAYLLREALARCREYSETFLFHVGLAERYRQRRLFARAAREFKAAVPHLPENASIHNFIWNLYIREGRYGEAIEHCQAVLRFTPHYLFQAAASNDLAYCMVERGENANLALLYTEKARELAPHMFDAHVADTIAWLAFKQGRYDEALRRIEEVIEAGVSEDHALLPTSMHFYHYGHILQALGRESEAQESFATARELEVDADSDWGITRRLRKEQRKTR